MKKLIFIPIILIFSILTYAQKKAESIKSKDIELLAQMEKGLENIATTVVTDTLPEERAKANIELLALMKKMLNVPNSYNFAFTKIEHIAIQESDDKEFKIFTWGLADAKGVNKHFGFIQLNRSKPTFYELKDNSFGMQKPESQVLTPDKWYGALYYNIKKFKSKEGEKYLLFGLNFGDTVERTKICDVLTLKGGMPRFGSPVFEWIETKVVRGKEIEKKTTQNRILLTHSVDASVRLNYDGIENKVVYDHLETVPMGYSKSGFVSVPDGTYEAFQFKKGVWQHIEKLAINEMDEAPRPKPVLGNKTKIINKEDAKVFQWPDDVKKKDGN
jgi:hypothetical protein